MGGVNKIMDLSKWIRAVSEYYGDSDPHTLVGRQVVRALEAGTPIDGDDPLLRHLVRDGFLREEWLAVSGAPDADIWLPYFTIP